MHDFVLKHEQFDILALVCTTNTLITPCQTIKIVLPSCRKDGAPTLHATRWPFVTIPLTPCYRAWPHLCMVSMHNTMVTRLLHYVIMFFLICFGYVHNFCEGGDVSHSGHCIWLKESTRYIHFQFAHAGNHVHDMIAVCVYFVICWNFVTIVYLDDASWSSKVWSEHASLNGSSQVWSPTP